MAVPQQVLDKPAPSEPPKSDRSFTIVLVEDDKDIRETLATLLKMDGHRVTTAVNGREGLATILAVQPDYALIDISMPLMNGYEVAQRLVESGQSQSTTTIALTGHGQPEDIQRATDAGFDAHLIKPIELSELYRLLV